MNHGAFVVVERAAQEPCGDHLDGGLRPATIVELASEFGYDGLPTTDPDELAAWIRRGADRKSLELYLETFAHTVGVLQERDAIIIKKTSIGNNVLFGGNCIVHGGCTIKHGAVILGGAILLPNTVVGENELWGGLPARKIKDLPPYDQRDQSAVALDELMKTPQ